MFFVVALFVQNVEIFAVDRLDLRQTEIFRASTRTNPPSFVYLSDTIAITAGKNNQSEKMSLSVVGLSGRIVS